LMDVGSILNGKYSEESANGFKKLSLSDILLNGDAKYSGNGRDRQEKTGRVTSRCADELRPTWTEGWPNDARGDRAGEKAGRRRYYHRLPGRGRCLKSGISDNRVRADEYHGCGL